MRSVRLFFPAVVLALGCALVWRTRQQVAVPLKAPLTGVLGQLTGYTYVDQTISDDERRLAGMTDVVARVYRRDTTVAFSTLVSYYDRQARGKTIHSPRNCLPGSGWEILERQRRALRVGGASFQVNSVLLKNGQRVALAYYWYQGRGRVEADEYVVKWNLLRDSALLGHSEEALVRVVVPVTQSASSMERPTAALSTAYGVGDEIAARMLVDVRNVLPERS